MGKSNLLQKLAETAASPLVTARKLINRPDPRTLFADQPLIIIDALDEVAAKREGDAIDLVLQKLGTLGYPRFVLSCRVADWKAATSAEAIREQYLDAPLQLHLKPLDRREQLATLAATVGNERAEVLIEHYEKYGLDFLGNPQTLELIARLPIDRPLPTGRGAVFEQAIDILRVEHRNARGGSELARDAALDAAGAAFAGLILSGSANIVRYGSRIRGGRPPNRGSSRSSTTATSRKSSTRDCLPEATTASRTGTVASANFSAPRGLPSELIRPRSAGAYCSCSMHRSSCPQACGAFTRG